MSYIRNPHLKNIFYFIIQALLIEEMEGSELNSSNGVRSYDYRNTLS